MPSQILCMHELPQNVLKWNKQKALFITAALSLLTAGGVSKLRSPSSVLKNKIKKAKKKKRGIIITKIGDFSLALCTQLSTYLSVKTVKHSRLNIPKTRTRQ